MFKKGDRVKYIGNREPAQSERRGKTATIKEDHGSLVVVAWDDPRHSYKPTAFWKSKNFELIEDKPNLDRLMQEYKDARAAHVRAKEQQAAAQRGVHLFATELQRARDALLAEIDKSTAPKENSNA